MRSGDGALAAIRAGLKSGDAGVREGCCRLLDHLVDVESMEELTGMADDPDATRRSGSPRSMRWRVTGARGTSVLRAMAAELVAKFARFEERAAAALVESHTHDPSPAVPKKAGWRARRG
ncbi:hypothetical protein ACVNF4_22845 [Streptomyces sp. S6]